MSGSRDRASSAAPEEDLGPSDVGAPDVREALGRTLVYEDGAESARPIPAVRPPATLGGPENAPASGMTIDYEETQPTPGTAKAPPASSLTLDYDGEAEVKTQPAPGTAKAPPASSLTLDYDGEAEVKAQPPRSSRSARPETTIDYDGEEGPRPPVRGQGAGGLTIDYGGEASGTTPAAGAPPGVKTEHTLDYSGRDSATFSQTRAGKTAEENSLFVAGGAAHAAHRSLVHADPGRAGEIADGDYEVESEIGRGGMGVVYEGRQRSVGRRIALKMLTPEVMANPRQRAKFLAEAVVMADLDHPNIVPFYDLGQSESGDLFYAMKRVRGVPWDESIGGKTLAENLAILLSLCDAVAYAHSRGVVHRDLKPANVMLGAFGEVLLMDWGIAVSFTPEGRARPLTAGNAKGGTPAYMAPEMVSGDPARIGPWCDIYLLGACLFEIVTGRRPHSGRSLEDCMARVRRNELETVDAQGELFEIARKAMAMEPTDRYASVQEFRAALQSYLEHQESIRLCEEGQKDLIEAVVQEDYDLFAQARFGFRQALSLWAENPIADEARVESEFEYARTALERGDLDLALSLLSEREPRHEALLLQTREAMAERTARVARNRRLKSIALGLTAVTILILSVSVIWIRQSRIAEELQRRKAVAEAERARQAEMEAQAEKQRALDAKGEAERQRAAADRARVESETARQAAEAERRRAEEARAEEKAQREAAEAAKAQEIRQREIAEQERHKAVSALQARLEAEKREQEAKSRLARMGELREDRSWIFDAAGAQARQAAAAEKEAWPAERVIPLPGGSQMKLVLIPAGSFVMGSPAEESGRSADEYLHRVTLRRSFYLAVHELTRAQHDALLGLAPAAGEAGELPRAGFSWKEVREELLPKLQPLAPEGFRFRLPTEAEWEYACRAGTATAYHTGGVEGLADAGWFFSNSGEQPHPVGRKKPNAWGLYDMHGNLMEWCVDGYADRFYLSGPEEDPEAPAVEEKIVARGGSYGNLAEHCRSAYRSWGTAGRKAEVVGVRVALVPAGPPP